MTKQQRRASVAELSTYEGLDQEAAALVERSLGPRSRSMLLDVAAAFGHGPGQLVLDAGCRDANHAIPLVQRLGCRVVGVDIVDAGFARGSYRLPAPEAVGPTSDPLTGQSNSSSRKLFLRRRWRWSLWPP